MKIQNTFKANVIWGSLGFSLAIIAALLFDTQQTISYLAAAKAFIFSQFSWFYILLSAFFLFFLLFLALGRYGDIKLGSDEEEPEFKLGSWIALLFTSGIGIGIVFLGVAEPLSHFLSPIGEYEKVRTALFFSIFHWSISAWAIYGLIALTIAYFGFRYKLPFSLRSCFYPLLKEKINGKVGDVIDILGICTTLFGVVATLGYSAIRLAAAFHSMHLLDNSPYLVPLILVSVFIIAILISLQGIANGFRILSELNLGVTFLFMLLVLLFGPTIYLISAFTENIGTYLSGLIRVGFKAYAYDVEHLDWFMDWTVFYWAWWFSWAPGFGIFIARISRGRTLREFIFGVLMVQKDLDSHFQRVSNIVVMGIGEPFDNYDNVMEFLRILNYPNGFEIGARHITVSTCGIVPKIKEFANFDLQVNLAISLHAPNNTIRNQMMKINKQYPLEQVIEAVKEYIEKTNRRVTFEYILLSEINDEIGHAEELVKLIRGINCYVNLIPYNEISTKPFQQTSKKKADAFFEVLRKNGINATVRVEHGSDIMAACGQLRAKRLKEERK